MTEVGALKIIDRLKARGFVYGRITEEEVNLRTADLVDTFAGFDDNDVDDAYKEFMNSNREAPQPVDILWILRRRKNRGGNRMLSCMTKEEIKDIRAVCKIRKLCPAAYQDYTKDGSVDWIFEPYPDFKKRIIRLIEEGKLT